MRIALLCAIVLNACGGDDTTVSHAPSQQEPDLVQENRDAVKLEDRDIDLYVRRHELQLRKSGTGVRYHLLRDVPGDTVTPGEWAKVNYRMELLNGDTTYASVKGKPESFLVEMDDVESGLHEGIQHLSPGDSALIIIPSYRAHGLIGDMDKVPMRSTIVYQIGLVAKTPDE